MEELVSLKEVRSVRVPGCIYSGIEEEVVSYEFYGFGDASNRAPWCTRCVANSGRYVPVMASKTRVAPLAKQVTASLELMAGRNTDQLRDAVQRVLQSRISINNVYLWLDSITALYWITGEREWSQFVENRVNEILRLTTREQWNHCQG